MLLLDIVWYALHCKDLPIKFVSIGQTIFDSCQSLLMDLVHVYAQTCLQSVLTLTRRLQLLTSDRDESAIAAIAFEMLGFLGRDQDCRIIEVSLTVVTPRSSKDFLYGGMALLSFRHGAGTDHRDVHC